MYAVVICWNLLCTKGFVTRSIPLRLPIISNLTSFNWFLSKILSNSKVLSKIFVCFGNMYTYFVMLYVWLQSRIKSLKFSKLSMRDHVMFSLLKSLSWRMYLLDVLWQVLFKIGLKIGVINVKIEIIINEFFLCILFFFCSFWFLKHSNFKF